MLLALSNRCPDGERVYDPDFTFCAIPTCPRGTATYAHPRPWLKLWPSTSPSFGLALWITVLNVQLALYWSSRMVDSTHWPHRKRPRSFSAVFILASAQGGLIADIFRAVNKNGGVC